MNSTRRITSLTLSTALLLGVCTVGRAAILNVPAGGSLQSAFDSANPGDTIVLEAGAVYPTSARGSCPGCPNDAYNLRNKGGSTEFITVQTSAIDRLPGEGYRVGLADVTNMAKIESSIDGVPTLTATGGAHHYRFIGIEFAPAPGHWAYTLVELGTGAETTLSQMPHHIEIDRCYIHGDATTLPGTKRGVLLGGMHLTVMNSYISEIHADGQDAQAIAGWSAPGPFKILNNYLEASTENVLFGGENGRVANVVPADIEVKYNHLYKPLRWHHRDPSYVDLPGDAAWTVKNLFELKNARRVVVQGNVFENNWQHAQDGYAVLITPRGQELNPWSIVEDVVFTHNIIKNTGAGINVSAHDDLGKSLITQRIQIRDNLLINVNNTEFGGAGALFIFGTSRYPMRNITIDHNTALHGNQGNTLALIDSDNQAVVADGWTFTNNLVTYGFYGLHTSGGEGVTGLNVITRNYNFQRNAIIAAQNVSLYPNNLFPSSVDAVGFENPAAGDFQLKRTSPFIQAGMDGKDLGADIPALLAETCGAVTGVPRTTCSTRPPVQQEALPAPTLNLPSVLPLNAKISATMPPEYTIISYSWSISPQDRPTASPSTRAPLRAGHAIFPTPSGVASLAPLGLVPGNYLVEVVAIDSQGRWSPATGGFVTLVPGDLAGAVVFPNPWRADRHAATPSIIFAGLAANTSIKIFTVSGHLVRKLPPSSSSTTWNLRTESGELAASGLYIYLLTTDDGSKLTGKLAIIR